MIDSIISAIRDFAATRPERVAVIAEEQKITYAT